MGLLSPDRDKEKASRPILKWLGISALVYFPVMIVIAIVHRNDPPPKSEPVKPHVADCSGWEGESTARGLLTAWRDGQSSTPFWFLGREGSRLFAVRDFKLLSSGTYREPQASTAYKKKSGKAAQSTAEPLQEFVYIYRVDSSTKGGLQVTNDWGVKEIAAGPNCYVVGIQQWQ